VTGHTGKYDGCNYPMVGGCTMMATGKKDDYITPAMAEIGNKVIMTKGCAMEAAGIFAVTFKDKIAKEFGQQFADEAENIFYQMSTVEDALSLAKIGVRENGITAMHDATECGVYGGLYEIAQAWGVGMVVEKDKILLSDTVHKICDRFGMDPYISISEGTLLATCKPSKINEALEVLNSKNIDASVVGEITTKEKGIVLRENGEELSLQHPEVDPFWEAFGREVEK